jgi:hypothetical protein
MVGQARDSGYVHESGSSDDTVSLSESSDSEDAHDILVRLKRRVTSIINRLVTTTTLLRKLGAVSRQSRADQSFSLDIAQHIQLRQHLSFLLSAMLRSKNSNFEDGTQEFILDTLRGKHVESFKEDKRHSRILNANLKRQHRFQYARRHAKALGFDRLRPTAASSTRNTWDMKTDLQQLLPRWIHASIANAYSYLTFGTSRGVIVATSSLNQSSVMTESENDATQSLEGRSEPETDATNPTQLGQLAVPLRPTFSEGATTTISTTKAKLNYPRPPKLQPGADVFRCPCCCQTLSKTIALSRSRWR